MKNDIGKFSSVLSRMVENIEDGCCWKNLKLGPETFAEMTALPLRVKGELTPYTRAVLLNRMLEYMLERDCARFILKVREYQLSMFPLITADDLAEDMDIDGYEGDPSAYSRKLSEDDVRELMRETLDYINPEITMEQWCADYLYDRMFDPVERSAEWEEKIYDVEKDVAEILKGVEICMGYCHDYWSTKREVLAGYGIEWRSPSVMNPGVMFD